MGGNISIVLKKKKQLLVKCTVNELISPLQVFGLICYGITASFMKIIGGSVPANQIWIKAEDVYCVVTKFLKRQKDQGAHRDNKNILKTVFEKSLS